ncbi:hypothetical protein RDI58_013807 [Solanum bulbocastanum]|uniref:Uncharacterized protein n=1 Tax=Solanum bulbocastanum TaxID=147425 RepID=A0AAN8TRE8_SOLBU
MERGMDNFCFFNLKARTTYYLAYNCWGSISNEDKDESEINQPANSQGALLQGTNVIAYDSSDLATTTNNFSLANKIGHGGFGNGVLENGVEIAMKKQDVTSRQGFTESCKKGYSNMANIYSSWKQMVNKFCSSSGNTNFNKKTLNTKIYPDY